MFSRASALIPVVLSALAFPSQVGAVGAWAVDAQYRFSSPDGVTIVGPFIDGDGLPWVLANRVVEDELTGALTDAACQLIGPFNQDRPAPTEWGLLDSGGGMRLTQCLAVEPGPDDGFLVRGVVLETPVVGGPQPIACEDDVCGAFEAQGQRDECVPDCGPLGFIVLLDSAFEIVWGPTFGRDHVERGTYSQPLPNIGWSESRNRVLVFFQSVLDLGFATVPELHGVSITDGTGLVRRVITSWGSVTNGQLEGLLVSPQDGRFLVVGNENGSEFLLYNGLESIDSYRGGEVDWSQEDIDYVQFGDDESLYVVHHPRLDLTAVDTTLTRISTDGASQFYSRDLARTLQIENSQTGEAVDVVLPRPLLSYATATTATFVRQAGNDFVLHVYDSFNGEELAIQPLTTIDENRPTHMADARIRDRLILMTAAQNSDGSIVRFVSTILWDINAETPGDFGGGPDGAGDVGTLGDGGNDGGGGGKPGCCSVIDGQSPAGVWLLATAVLGWPLIRRRE